ncbi:hypothetical protein C8J57DRAFT_1525879 [Mycena rebaudengoi]|nr:hypothetical protein C8J57DRAFT_1525879 [Mycena rebaudengoi]
MGCRTDRARFVGHQARHQRRHGGRISPFPSQAPTATAARPHLASPPAALRFRPRTRPHHQQEPGQQQRWSDLQQRQRGRISPPLHRTSYPPSPRLPARTRPHHQQEPGQQQGRRDTPSDRLPILPLPSPKRVLRRTTILEAPILARTRSLAHCPRENRRRVSGKALAEKETPGACQRRSRASDEETSSAMCMGCTTLLFGSEIKRRREGFQRYTVFVKTLR